MAWKEYSGDEHGYRKLIKKHHPDAKVGRGNAEGITQHTVGHQDHVVGHYDSHHKTGKVKVYEGTIMKKFGEFVAEAVETKPGVKSAVETIAKHVAGSESHHYNTGGSVSHKDHGTFFHHQAAHEALTKAGWVKGKNITHGESEGAHYTKDDHTVKVTSRGNPHRGTTVHTVLHYEE